jgi:hypothetical protein
LSQPEKRCQTRDLSVGQTHMPRPAAASRATLTLMKDGHAASLTVSVERAKSRLNIISPAAVVLLR